MDRVRRRQHVSTSSTSASGSSGVVVSSISANLNGLSVTNSAYTTAVATVTLTLTGTSPVMVCFMGGMEEIASSGGTAWSFLVDGGYINSLSATIGVADQGDYGGSSWTAGVNNGCYPIAAGVVSSGSHSFAFVPKGNAGGQVKIGYVGTSPPVSVSEARFYVYELGGSSASGSASTSSSSSSTAPVSVAISSVAFPATSFTNTTPWVCLAGSTLTFTAASSQNASITFKGTLTNIVTGTDTQIGLLLDGAAKGLYCDYTEATVGYDVPCSFAFTTSPLTSGAHTACLVALANGTGEFVIDGTAETSGRRAVFEVDLLSGGGSGSSSSSGSASTSGGVINSTWTTNIPTATGGNTSFGAAVAGSTITLTGTTAGRVLCSFHGGCDLNTTGGYITATMLVDGGFDAGYSSGKNMMATYMGDAAGAVKNCAFTHLFTGLSSGSHTFALAFSAPEAGAWLLESPCRHVGQSNSPAWN